MRECQRMLQWHTASARTAAARRQLHTMLIPTNRYDTPLSVRPAGVALTKLQGGGGVGDACDGGARGDCAAATGGGKVAAKADSSFVA